MTTTRKLTIATCFAALLAGSGCSTLSDFGSMRKETLRNEQGHVIGYKEMLRSERTGEVIAQVQLYTPVADIKGEVIGYEEQARDGTIIRDLDGRTIGGRFADLRSRGTNAKNRGLMIVMRPADGQQLALSKPKVAALMASLSASDLRRVQ